MEGDHATLGRTAPSWSYAPYRFPNGYALLSVATGFTGMVFVSMPGGLLLLPGAVLTAIALWAGNRGIRRAGVEPKAGGQRAAQTGIALALAGPVLLVVWVLLGAW